MHDVVEMLLTRIKDYPEDFVSDPQRWGSHGEPNKWQKALGIAKEVMTEEEKVVISDALELAKRAIYMGAALKTIMSDEVREGVEIGVIAKPYQHSSGLFPTGITTATAIATQEAQINQIEYRQQMAQTAMQNAMNQNSLLWSL